MEDFQTLDLGVSQSFRALTTNYFNLFASCLYPVLSKLLAVGKGEDWRNFALAAGRVTALLVSWGSDKYDNR